MMVSRQFFEEASTIWLRSVTIQGENRHSVEFTKYCAQSRVMNSALTNVNTAWPKGYASLGNRFSDMIHKCKGLRLLQLRVPEDAFEDVDKITCVHVLTSTDFASLKPIKDILASTSLQRVEVIAEPSEEAQTESEHAQWRGNVRALGEYISMELEMRRAAREEDALLSVDTTPQDTNSPTTPVKAYSPPSESESPTDLVAAQLKLLNLMRSNRDTKKQSQSASKETLGEKVTRMEDKFARMEEEIKGLKQRLDVCTCSQAP